MYVTNPSNFGFILTSFGLHDIFYKFSITCNGKMANVTYLLFSSCLFYIWWTSVLTKIICISVKIDWKWYEICTKFSTWYNVESIIFMNVRLDMVLIGRKVKYRSIHLRRHAFGAVLHQSIWRCRTSRKPILLANTIFKHSEGLRDKSSKLCTYIAALNWPFPTRSLYSPVMDCNLYKFYCSSKVDFTWAFIHR